MRLVASYTLKYNGRIRRANIPFEVNSEDVDVLCGEWGCKPVDEQPIKAVKKATNEICVENAPKPANIEEDDKTPAEDKKTAKRAKRTAKKD